MFARSAVVLLASLALGARAAIQVTTPTNDGTLNLCQSYKFDISGDSGPYYGFIVSGEDPCGPALKEIGPITGSSYTWVVDTQIPAGKTVMLAVENDADVDGYSGKVSITGSNTACIAAAASHTTSHATNSAPNNAAASPSDESAASRSVSSGLSVLSLVGVAAFALL